MELPAITPSLHTGSSHTHGAMSHVHGEIVDPVLQSELAALQVHPCHRHSTSGSRGPRGCCKQAPHDGAAECLHAADIRRGAAPEEMPH